MQHLEERTVVVEILLRHSLLFPSPCDSARMPHRHRTLWWKMNEFWCNYRCSPYRKWGCLFTPLCTQDSGEVCTAQVEQSRKSRPFKSWGLKVESVHSPLAMYLTPEHCTGTVRPSPSRPLNSSSAARSLSPAPAPPRARWGPAAALPGGPCWPTDNP